MNDISALFMNWGRRSLADKRNFQRVYWLMLISIYTVRFQTLPSVSAEDMIESLEFEQSNKCVVKCNLLIRLHIHTICTNMYLVGYDKLYVLKFITNMGGN